MLDYNAEIRRYSNLFMPILIPKRDYEEMKLFASVIVEAKELRKEHTNDSRSQEKRQLTGLLGERAVEIAMKQKVIEWKIGDSKDFNHPDVQRLNIGVKTVLKGSFPIIFKKNNYPQIFCIRESLDSRVVWVCGMATAEVLNKYQSDELIHDKYLRARGTKTGFYGFKYLIPVNELKGTER